MMEKMCYVKLQVLSLFNPLLHSYTHHPFGKVLKCFYWNLRYIYAWIVILDENYFWNVPNNNIQIHIQWNNIIALLLSFKISPCHLNGFTCILFFCLSCQFLFFEKFWKKRFLGYCRLNIFAFHCDNNLLNVNKTKTK